MPLEIVTGHEDGSAPAGFDLRQSQGQEAGGVTAGPSAARDSADSADDADFKWDSDDERDRDSGADVSSPREDRKVLAGKMD